MTARRLSAARRRLQTEKDKVGLFPDMHPKTTPEERIASFDEGCEQHTRERRNVAAKDWRQCRALLRSAPATQRELILRYWNRRVYPGTPQFLLGLIVEVTKKGRDLAAEFRHLAEIAELGQQDNPKMARVIAEVIAEGRARLERKQTEAQKREMEDFKLI